MRRSPGFGGHRKPASFARTHFSDAREFSSWRVVTGGDRAVVFRDDQGRSHALGYDVSRNSENSVSEVIISGSVAILVFRTEIVAVSLQGVRDHDPEPILWRRSLSSDGKSQTRIGSRKSFSDDVFYYRLDQARAVRPSPDLFVGPVLGDRMFIRNGSELTCLDLLTSQALWHVSTEIRNGVTVADDGRVALVSADYDFVEVFDAYDGHAVQRQPWTPNLIWASTPTSVLTCEVVPETEGRKNIVELKSPLSDRTVLTTTGYRPAQISEGDKSTFGKVVGKRWMFLSSRDGQITVWDLLNHREVVSVKYPGFERLTKMHGAHIGDLLIVLADNDQKIEDRNFDIASSEIAEAANQSHYGARGVFAFSTDTGELVWKREFKRTWGCTTMQPSATPMLVMTRARTKVGITRNIASKRYLDLQGLDIRTGETLIEILDKEVPSSPVSATQTTLLPLKSQMLVEAEQSLIVFQFGVEEDADGDSKKLGDDKRTADKENGVADAEQEKAEKEAVPTDN